MTKFKFKNFNELHIYKIVMLPAQKATMEYNNNVLPKVLEKKSQFPQNKKILT